MDSGDDNGSAVVELQSQEAEVGLNQTHHVHPAPICDQFSSCGLWMFLFSHCMLHYMFQGHGAKDLGNRSRLDAAIVENRIKRNLKQSNLVLILQPFASHSTY